MFYNLTPPVQSIPSGLLATPPTPPPRAHASPPTPAFVMAPPPVDTVVFAAPGAACWHGRLLQFKGDGTPGDTALAERWLAGEGAALVYETTAQVSGPDVAAKLRAFNARVAAVGLLWRPVQAALLLAGLAVVIYWGVTRRDMTAPFLSLGAVMFVVNLVYRAHVRRAVSAFDVGPCFSLRGEVRAKVGIPGDCVGDCCIETWCGPCALMQEARTVARWDVAA